MKYRLANQKDLKALQALGLASYGTMKAFLTDENWKEMETFLKSENLYSDLLLSSTPFICENKRGIIGMGFLIPSGHPTQVFPSETNYIRMVGVHPDAGGQGIAQYIPRLCIEKAKETGEKSIMLHTSELLLAARHIYEKMGFRKVRKLDLHYGMEYWLYRMDI